MNTQTICKIDSPIDQNEIGTPTPTIMNVNNLPEDVVRHEIMEYLKPVYKVVEIEYVRVDSELTPERGEPMTTHTYTEKRLFKVMPDKHYEKEVAPYPGAFYKEKPKPFAEGKCEISRKLLSDFETKEKRIYENHNGYVDTTYIYLSHIVVC